jgi:hypothetical protein
MDLWELRRVGMGWTDVVHDRHYWSAVVNTEMNFRIS